MRRCKKQEIMEVDEVKEVKGLKRAERAAMNGEAPRSSRQWPCMERKQS